MSDPDKMVRYNAVNEQAGQLGYRIEVRVLPK
jgi:hypothetical protein